MNGFATEEREELGRYVRQWLDERAPLDEVRRIMETPEGYDSAMWKELGELGWLAMAIPEEYGGAGYGFGEVAVVSEEMGRALFPSPFLGSTVMAATLVEGLGTQSQKSELLGGIARGERCLAVARGERLVSVEPDGAGWTLSGTVRFVLDGVSADTLLVSTDHGVFVVDDQAQGVRRERLDVMDLTRPQARIDLTDTPAVRLGQKGEDPGAVLEAMSYRAVAALAMEQVGGTQACLDMSVAYAKDRHQFGRPIGSFQAIKHMCADMLVGLESARSAAHHLATAIDEDPDEVPLAAPVAKSYCSEAYFRAAADTIQIHGGIGFTWEHSAHLYLKRAKSSQLLFGGAERHREELARRIAI